MYEKSQRMNSQNKQTTYQTNTMTLFKMHIGLQFKQLI